jgi:hypothetical protein
VSVEVKNHVFLTSVLVRGEWSVLRPSRFSPGKEPPRKSLVRRLGGPRAGLDILEKRKISRSCQKSNPDFLSVQPVARRYTD